MASPISTDFLADIEDVRPEDCDETSAQPRPGIERSTSLDEANQDLDFLGGNAEIGSEFVRRISRQFVRFEHVLSKLIIKQMEPISRVSAQMAELRKETARIREQLSVPDQDSKVTDLRLETEELRAQMLSSLGINCLPNAVAGNGEAHTKRPGARVIPFGGTENDDSRDDTKSISKTLVQAMSGSFDSEPSPVEKFVSCDLEVQKVAPTPGEPSPLKIAVPKGSAPMIYTDKPDENPKRFLQKGRGTNGPSHQFDMHPEGTGDTHYVSAYGSMGSPSSPGVSVLSIPSGNGNLQTPSYSSQGLAIVPSMPMQWQGNRNSISSMEKVPSGCLKPKNTRFSEDAGWEAFPSENADVQIRLQKASERRSKRLNVSKMIIRGNSKGLTVKKSQGHQRQSALASAAKFFRAKAVTFEEGEEETRRDSGLEIQKNNTQSAKPQIFADANAMKEKLRANLGRPKYCVTNFYHTEGCAQRFARSSIFENATLAVIALNAIWIAIDTEYNDKILIEADPVFQIAENLFCLYFSSEWLIRFLAFAQKSNCLRDGWFVFDSALVFMMVAETWVMYLVFGLSGGGGDMGNTGVVRLVRLLRLTRMARMAKLLVAVPELTILLKGISVAFRSVMFTLLLLVVIIYIFGIAFTQLLVDTNVGKKHFDGLADSMLTLLLHATFVDDLPRVVEAVGREHFLYGAFLMLFVLIASLTVMNMLIGILCEVVSVVSAVEKENCLLNFVRSRMQEMLRESGLDADGDGMINKTEFEKLIELPEAAMALQDVGVDVLGLVDSADFIFGMDGTTELTFGDFMDVVLQLRGSNTATVKDVVDLRKFFTQELSMVEDKVARSIIALARGHQLGFTPP